MRLDELQPGKEAKIVQSGASHRLREMGLAAGNRIRFLRRSPWGDPLEVALLGAHLALRRDEARRVEVEICTPGRR